jgi:outer membrane immunogenic protein
MRKLTLSLLALTALTGAAAAADLPAQKAPPVAPESAINWTGAYGGVQLGGASGATDLYLPSSAYSGSWNNSGFIGGGHLGYNYQYKSFVFGVQGSFDLLSVSGTLNNYANFAPNIFTARSYHDWLASVDGRVGYAVKNYLFYAIGGYAFVANNSVLSVNAAQVASVSNTINGYDVGGGVEYAINNQWSARAEYRYYNFNHNTNNFLNSARQFTESYSTSVGRVGLTYKFNQPEPVVVAAKY